MCSCGSASLILEPDDDGILRPGRCKHACEFSARYGSFLNWCELLLCSDDCPCREITALLPVERVLAR